MFILTIDTCERLMASRGGGIIPPDRRKFAKKDDKNSEYDFLKVFLESF